MITPVATPPTDLARAPSAADGAGASKQKASSFADDLASIMSETDAADETKPIPSQAVAAPPGPPEKSGTAGAHHTLHPMSQMMGSANEAGNATSNDLTDQAQVETGTIEKITSALVSQNGKAATPTTETIKQDNAKKADTEQDAQDTKGIATATPEWPLPVVIVPTPPLITAQSEPFPASFLTASTLGSPTKISSAHPSNASHVATPASEAEGEMEQETDIEQNGNIFALKQASTAITGQTNTPKEGSQESKHGEAANSASAGQEKNTTSSDDLTLPLDLQPLNNGLLGADVLTPKKPLAIDTLGALTGHQEPTSSSSGPVPYGMLPIEIGLGALQGRRAIEVRLSPDDLGTVEIRLEISADSKISANITADRPATLAMMMNDAAKLRSALDQTGMTTTADTLQFSLKQDGNFTQSNGQHAEQRQNGQPQSQRRDGSPPPLFQDAVPIASLRRAVGLLDVNI